MNKLRKSRTNRVLAGVCGGIGEYLNIDPVIIRIIWIILTFAPGFPGLLSYLICALIIPEDDSIIYEDDNNSNYNSNKNFPLIIGIAFILIGTFFLLHLISPRFYIFNILKLSKYWPVVLIILGIYIIVKAKNK